MQDIQIRQQRITDSLRSGSAHWTAITSASIPVLLAITSFLDAHTPWVLSALILVLASTICGLIYQHALLSDTYWGREHLVGRHNRLWYSQLGSAIAGLIVLGTTIVLTQM